MPTKSITKQQKKPTKYEEKNPDPFKKSCYDPCLIDWEDTLDRCITELYYHETYQDVIAELEAGYDCKPGVAMHWLKKKYFENTDHGAFLWDRLKYKY